MTRFIGLTGSIGMGKSTAARQLRRMGIPVYDADAAVHAALAPGGAAFAAVVEAFPDSIKNEKIDRQILGRIVFSDSAALKKLEKILHPVVRIEEKKFRARMWHQRRPIAVLDIPLLFETGGHRRVDAVAVVTAPAFVQSRRVLARPGMDRQKFRAILARQMPDRQKRPKADFVIHTGLGHHTSWRQWRRVLRDLIS